MARYSVKVDWLSIVLPYPAVGEGGSESSHIAAVTRTLHNEIGEAVSDRLFSGLQPLGYGRAPYTSGWCDPASGIWLWEGGQIPHFCVEFSGKGVDYLRENGLLDWVMARTTERVSRLDVAVDLEQDTPPIEFLKLRAEGRQQTFSQMQSTGGETCYVGSRHSERYMRVYRYAAPHPRSHLLRIETVFRRAYAKQACSQILASGLDAVAKAALEDFGFGGVVDFGEAVESADLSVYRPERNGGKTLRWLITQVAPAFQRLCREGDIPDPEAFIQSYFLSGLIEDGTISE